MWRWFDQFEPFMSTLPPSALLTCPLHGGCFLTRCPVCQGRGEPWREQKQATPQSAPAAHDHGKASGRPVAGSEGPNRTETAARDLLARLGAPMTFEGRKFDILGGGRYTPDWVSEEAKVAVECKAEYVASRDGHRRWLEAASMNPGWLFVWLRFRTKGRKGRRVEIEIRESA